MNLSLHSYQRKAVKFLHENPRAMLALDVGLGKSAVTLSALTPDHLPALIVAPKRVAEKVWSVERDKWRPDLSISVAAGSPAKRREALDAGADLTVLGRDNLKDVPVPHRYRTVVWDESHGMKSRASVRWKLAKKIGKNVPFIIELTGTPAPNTLIDLWSQIYLLDDGDRLDSSIVRFRDRYFTPGRQLRTGVVTEWKPRPGAERAIHRKIDDICLSMSAADHLDLPPVTYNHINVSLNPTSRTAYVKMRDTLVADLTSLLDGQIHTAANAAVLTSKLSQISAGFLYDDDGLGGYTPLHEEKINAVIEVIEGTGSPVLVFYRFKAEFEALKQIHGATDVRHKDAIERWNRGEIPVLLAHPASAGMGLNLQGGGHTAIWTSLPWSLEEWIQGNGRLHRQGQDHHVMVHCIMAEKTVDHLIWDRLHSKRFTQDALLAHLRG